jgi:hypothetical protein
MELTHGNSRVKVAGTASFEGGDLVVKDFIVSDTEKVIETGDVKCTMPLQIP